MAYRSHKRHCLIVYTEMTDSAVKSDRLYIQNWQIVHTEMTDLNTELADQSYILSLHIIHIEITDHTY